MTQQHARFKGAPFSPFTIRRHKARSGYEWQYWNYRVGRFCRATKRELTPNEAREFIAANCYGCDPCQITLER